MPALARLGGALHGLFDWYCAHFCNHYWRCMTGFVVIGSIVVGGIAAALGHKTVVWSLLCALWG